MAELTFGEQVKVVLKRKGMTIKQLAELIEERTGKKMSRQNLTQRLSRDNFQEQDMRMIAGILECPLYLSILEKGVPAAPSYRRPAPEQKHEPASEQKYEPEYEPGYEQAEREAVEAAAAAQETAQYEEPEEEPMESNERDITVGELLDFNEELNQMTAEAAQEEKPEKDYKEGYEADYEAEDEEGYTLDEILAEVDALESEERERAKNAEPESADQAAGNKERARGWRSYLQRRRHGREQLPEEEAPEEPVLEEVAAEEDEFEQEVVYLDDEEYEEEEAAPVPDESGDYPEDTERGEVNPYTGHEYKSNSVRMHPHRIGYVQVYDRAEHRWTDMTEWAFLGYQERKKELLGKDYEPPIYLD